MKIIFLILIVHISFSQNQFKLKRSDNLRIIDQKTKVFTGHVKMVRDTVSVFSDKTIIYENNNVDLFGNISIYNGNDIKITAQKGHFEKLINTFYFYIDSRYDDSFIHTFSDTLIHDYTHNYSTLLGNANVFNSKDSTRTLGKKIIMDGNDSFYVYGDAEYQLLKDSVTITSDTLKFNKTDNLSYAINNVQFLGNGFTATSRSSKYYITDSLIKYYGEPVIKYDNNEVRGDSIFTYMSGTGIKKLEVYGSAYTINVLDTNKQEINKIYGREIYIDFDNGKISQIKSLFNSISIYHIIDDSIRNGINSVSSDSLIIMFEKGEAKKTIIYGGVQGNYYPAGYIGPIKNDY